VTIRKFAGPPVAIPPAGLADESSAVDRSTETPMTRHRAHVYGAFAPVTGRSSAGTARPAPLYFVRVRGGARLNRCMVGGLSLKGGRARL